MRLLVWNIQQFSLGCIYDENRVDGFDNIWDSETAWRLEHILRAVWLGNPDVFIIIENQSDPGALGGLCSGNGRSAALEILDCLRCWDQTHNDGNAEWCLVPPLRLVGERAAESEGIHTEVISVFYKNSVRRFEGPFIWPKNRPRKGEKVAIPPSPNAKCGPYPKAWSAALPERNYYAGQWLFYSGNLERLDFGGEGKRNPFLTKFRERYGFGRVFNIVSVHPQWKNEQARMFVSMLSNIGGVSRPPEGTVTVFCGDFNINIFDRDIIDTGYRDFLLHLDDLNYQFLVGPHSGSTRYRRNSNATPDDYLKEESLDNVLVCYGQGTAPPTGCPDAIIVNAVTGVPGYPRSMWDSLEEIGNDADVFRRLENFGHIGHRPGTSDHLAISADL